MSRFDFKPKNKQQSVASKKSRTSTRSVAKRAARDDDRGAIRKSRSSSQGQSSNRWLLSLLTKSFLVVAIAGVVASGIYFGNRFLDRATERPIHEVIVEGSFSHLNKEMIVEEILPLINDGFLKSPLLNVKKQLEANPWIEYASVTRRWPDRLLITVNEERPIARWKYDGFINYKGKVVKTALPENLQQLPMLSGNDGQEKLVMENYQQLAQVLGAAGLTVSAIECDPLFSWSVTVNNRVKLELGREELMEKVQRFLTVYRTTLNTQFENIAVIDLRYGNALAVRWNINEENAPVVALH